MALPLIGFIGLLLLAIVLFLIGLNKTQANVNVGFAFVVFASIILFSTSMFIMNEGLELNTVSSITQSGTTNTISYASVEYSIDSWNWLRVLTDSIFYSGFVGLIIGFWKAYSVSKSRQVSDYDLM